MSINQLHNFSAAIIKDFPNVPVRSELVYLVSSSFGERIAFQSKDGNKG